MKNISPAIDEMHQKAVQLADEALSAKMRQELDDAQSNYLAAFQYESAAAMLLVNDQDMEPTRSILFRSAACLLLNLPFPHDTHFRQAERMVAFGLSGNPPEAIADELREVWRELIQYLHKEAARILQPAVPRFEILPNGKPYYTSKTKLTAKGQQL